jgi:putative membrane protein
MKYSLRAEDGVLMDWIRTGMSMISFGVTIYLVLEAFQESPESLLAHPLAHRFNSRNVGLFLVGVGTLSIMTATVEYGRTFMELRKYRLIRIWRPAPVIALLLSAGGVYLFCSILTKLL